MSEQPQRPFSARISVTKAEVFFTPQAATNELPLPDIEPALEAEVKALAKELQNWIKSEFTPPKNNGVHGATQFLPESEPTSNPTWFIGDLHGDLVALKVLTDFAREQDKRDDTRKPTKLFFLGDLVDGMPFSAEVVAWVMKEWNGKSQAQKAGTEATSPPQFEIQAVIGNHDEGLRFVEDDTCGKFISSVLPSTFAEELNQRNEQDPSDAWKIFGRAAIEFFKGLPRMVMLGKTIMVAHGGVPHSDVEIATKADLDSEQALSDFTWNRLHETAPKKIPNRVSCGSEQGIKDFNGFVAKLEAIKDIGFAPKALIRGHDHHEGNYQRYENYKTCAVLTLNAFTVNRGYFGQKHRDLALLRWVPAETNKMTLYRLKFENGALEQLWRALTPAEVKGDIQGKAP